MHGSRNVKLDVKSLTFARHSFDSDWILAMSCSSFLISSSYSPLSLMIFSFFCSTCCISLVIALTAPFCDFTSISNLWTLAYCKIKERKSTIWRTTFNKHYKSNKWTQTLSNFGKKIIKLRRPILQSKRAIQTPTRVWTNFYYANITSLQTKQQKHEKNLHNEPKNLHSSPPLLQ